MQKLISSKVLATIFVTSISTVIGGVILAKLSPQTIIAILPEPEVDITERLTWIGYQVDLYQAWYGIGAARENADATPLMVAAELIGVGLSVELAEKLECEILTRETDNILVKKIAPCGFELWNQNSSSIEGFRVAEFQYCLGSRHCALRDIRIQLYY